MSGAVLHYFDGRGKGEILRLMFSAAGIEFTEIILTKREEFEKLLNDGLLVFSQLPLVEIDGLKLVQTGAICRYIAKRGGLYGKTDKEAAIIDQHFEGSRDFNNNFLPFKFQETDVILKNLREKVLPRYLPAFEKVLKQNGSGYLVGQGLTMADVGLFEAVSNTVEFMGADAIKDFPNIQNFYKTVGNLPKISGFINGPQRKRANDERYVRDVKCVLGW